MEVDGPQSPEQAQNDADNSSQISSIKSISLDTQLKLDELSQTNENNLTRNLSIALTLETLNENCLYVLSKVFDFYVKYDQFDYANNLFNQIVKNFSFLNTNEFDNQLKELSLAIVNKKNTSFYGRLFFSQAIQKQDNFIIQLLDKYRHQFSFLKLTKPLNDNEINNHSFILDQIKLKYKQLIENYESFDIFKRLLVDYSKYIPVYGIQLVDALMSIEKILAFNQALLENDYYADRRSCNLFRKIFVIDLIGEFTFAIDKLENKVFYRWIEKSLEFHTRLSINTIVVNDIGEISYRDYDFFNEFKIDNDDIEIKYKLDNSWSSLNSLLDAISKKLTWPLHNFDKFSSQNEKLEHLFKLKSTTNAKLDGNKLSKQISFYGISLFLNKLIELDAICSNMFDDKLFLTISNNKTSNSTQNLSNINTKVVDMVKYVTQMWYQISNNKDLLIIINKCLNNCKLDYLDVMNKFNLNFFNVYQFNLNVKSIQINDDDSCLKQRIQHIAYLLSIDGSIKDAFTKISLVLKELSKFEQSKSKHDFYYQFSNNSDLIVLNFENIILYLTRLIVDYMHKIFFIEKKTQFTSFDKILSLFIVLFQLHHNNDAYKDVYCFLLEKKRFEFINFFDYIFDVCILEDFHYFSTLQEFKLEIDDSKSTNKIQNKLMEQVNKSSKNLNKTVFEYLNNNFDFIIDMM